MTEISDLPIDTQNDSIASRTERVKEKLHETMASGKETAASCCSKLRDESCQVYETTVDNIRKHPIEYVVGAAFLGAAVCYLILEGRSQPTFRDRYLMGPLSDASDSVSDSFHSLSKSLKFW